jgi:hypothetical protein
MMVLGGLAMAAKRGYDLYREMTTQGRTSPGPGLRSNGTGNIGYDTPTGTDPNAKYSTPGYEDKSLGQAVNQDQELVDELVQETHGDLGEAERKFNERSAGAPTLERQAREHEL